MTLLTVKKEFFVRRAIKLFFKFLNKKYKKVLHIILEKKLEN
jgi:hypothetical protein